MKKKSITKTPRHMPVMKAKCPTCPFGPNGSIRIQAAVTARILDASQHCHHPRLHDKEETHLCRGARDLQLSILHCMGFLSEPTDDAFKKKSDELLG